MRDADDRLDHVEVAVRTEAGTWPPEGYQIVPAAQRVGKMLDHAATSLEIPSTRGWVAVVRRRLLNPQASYSENGLRGRVQIRYRPAR